MRRDELFDLIDRTYGVGADQPWPDESGYYVFRHTDTLRWFAVVLNVPGIKVGVPTHEEIEIVLLKIDPERREELLALPDVYPAWHMNRKHWISIALDGELDDATLADLVDASYRLTRGRRKTRVVPNRANCQG